MEQRNKETKKQRNNNIIRSIILLPCLLLVISCSEKTELTDEISKELVTENTIFTDGRIVFNSKDDFLDEIEIIKSITAEEYYKQKIKPHLDTDFTPLRPYFEDEDEIIEYFEKKISEIEGETLLEEEIILDPNLQVLLNNNRELVINDEIYKYTEEGLYISPITNFEFSSIKSNSKLLSAKNKDGAKFIEIDYTPTITHDFSELTTEAKEKLLKTQSTSYVNGDSNIMDFKTSSTLDYDEEKRNSLWEKNIGINHTAYVYPPNRKRVKIKYWDTNYFLFNSAGMEVRFQKKIKIFGKVFWQKSYPTKVQLGVNQMSLIKKAPSLYVINDDWGKDTYQFKYYNRYYDKYGKEVSKYRTYSFPLNTLNVDIPDNIVDIYVKVPLIKDIKFDYTKVDLYKTINTLAQDQLKNGIKSLSNSLKDSSEPSFRISNQDSWNQTYIIGNIKETKSDNSIKDYIDLGFMIGYSHTIGDNFSFGNVSFSSYKTIEEVKSFDIYGAALYNGKWYGKRIVGAN